MLEAETIRFVNTLDVGMIGYMSSDSQGPANNQVEIPNGEMMEINIYAFFVGARPIEGTEIRPSIRIFPGESQVGDPIICRPNGLVATYLVSGGHCRLNLSRSPTWPRRS
jgi:hypothetical protein